MLRTSRPVNVHHPILLLLASSMCSVLVAAIATRKINVRLSTFGVMVAAFWSFCQSLLRRAASAVSYQPGESPWIGDLERGCTEMINPNFVEENYYVIHQLATHRAWKVRVVSKTLGVPLATFFHTSLSFACLPIVVVSVPDPLFAATVLRTVTSTCLGSTRRNYHIVALFAF